MGDSGGDSASALRQCVVACFILVVSTVSVGASNNAPPPSSENDPNESGALSVGRGWTLVRAEVERYSASPHPAGRNEYKRWLNEASKDIAPKLRRADVEQMIRTFDTVVVFDKAKSSDYFDTSALSGLVLARVFDPNDEHRFVSRGAYWGVGGSGRIDWLGLAMAGIDLYHDEAAFNLLLELGTKDVVGKTYSDDGMWSSPIIVALGLLRGYDANDHGRGVIKKELEDAMRRSDRNGDVQSLRASHFKALISSWDYAKGLTEAKRRDHQAFERSLWRAWALSAGGFTYGGRMTTAPRLFRWKVEYEESFVWVFTNPESTEDDLILAGSICPPLSDEGIRRLQAGAKGDSPRAERAKAVVSLMAKRRELEKEGKGRDTSKSPFWPD